MAQLLREECIVFQSSRPITHIGQFTTAFNTSSRRIEASGCGRHWTCLHAHIHTQHISTHRNTQDLGAFLGTHVSSQPSLISDSRNPVPSSGPCKHQTCTLYTGIHVDKTLIHIEYFFNRGYSDRSIGPVPGTHIFQRFWNV